MKHRVIFALVVISSIGCDKLKSVGKTTSASNIYVNISPPSPVVAAGSKQQFTAYVGNTTNQGVLWSVLGGDALSSCGFITIDGLYTAPTTIRSGCSVRAVSMADLQKNEEVSLTISPPVTISVSPSPATVAGCQIQAFTATVGNTTNTAVRWTLQGNPCGIITQTGVFKAAPFACTGYVRATSLADESKWQDVAVTTTAAVPVGIRVSPASVTLAPGQSQQFTAILDYECATVSQPTVASSSLSGKTTFVPSNTVEVVMKQ